MLKPSMRAMAIRLAVAAEGLARGFWGAEKSIGGRQTWESGNLSTGPAYRPARGAASAITPA
ncbi:hypothetical protein AZSI13_01320 [Azospira sp. I13]|nr:hypothetical protein AZSI13_01320 [Azospira sp. I13]